MWRLDREVSWGGSQTSRRGDDARLALHAPVRRENAIVTQDITTSGPSRRSIAKGAAWAVPAVSVAAAAPSLAASGEPPCTPGSLTATHMRCNPVGLGQTPYFRVTNGNTDCTVPVGTQVTLTTSGLVGLDIDFLESDNNNLQLLYTVGNTSTFETVAPIGPGESIDIHVYSPSFITVGVAALQEVRLNFDGARVRFNWTRVTIPFVGTVFLCSGIIQ